MRIWKQELVDIKLIDESTINANMMSNKEFSQLKKNIAKGGCSSSITMYQKEDGRFTIISGHHRFRACKDVGVLKIPSLYCRVSELTNDEILATQISHNSLHGSDDKAVLKKMFDEISSMDFKEFCFIDTSELEAISTMSDSITPVQEHYKVSLILYKKDAKLLEDLLQIVNTDKKDNDMVILSAGEEGEDEMLEALTAVKDKYKLLASGVAFSKILDLAMEALDKCDDAEVAKVAKEVLSES